MKKLLSLVLCLTLLIVSTVAFATATVTVKYNSINVLSGRTLDCYAATQTDELADYIGTTLYLQMQNQQGGWTTVRSWYASVNDRIACINSNTYTGQPGQYYRVKSVHIVYDPDLVCNTTKYSSSVYVQ